VSTTPDQVWEAQSLRASFNVRRWHVFPTHGQQNVGHHTACALSLLYVIHPCPSHALVQCLLFHDTAERWVGDVPAPVRRANKDFSDLYERLEQEHFAQHPTVHRAMSKLTEDELRWLKAIDVLELLMHMYDEIMLGNQHAGIVAQRAREYLQRDGTPEEVLDFVAVLAREWGRSFA
jgi:5'-deoxynucleotidase YfbR-like HD superfamily hydrolase